MEGIQQPSRSKQTIFGFKRTEHGQVGSNLFAGKGVKNKTPNDNPLKNSNAELAKLDLWSKLCAFFGIFTENYKTLADRVAIDVAKMMASGTPESSHNPVLEKWIINSEVFHNLISEQIFQSDFKLKKEDLNLIFKDILSSSSFDEFIDKASVKDLIHALKEIDHNDHFKINKIKQTLDTIKDINAEHYCDIAYEFHAKGMKEIAFQYYKEAVEKYPANVKALENLGTCYMQGKGCKVDKVEGLKYLKLAFKENPYSLSTAHGTPYPSPLTKLIEFYASNESLKGDKHLSVLYRNYFEKLQQTSDTEKQKELYKNLQRAEEALTLDIEKATGEQLLSAIEAYEQGLMGLSDPTKEKKLGEKLSVMLNDKKNKDIRDNYYLQGICRFHGYGCTKDLNSASFFLEKALAQNRHSPKITSLLSSCYEKVGGEAKQRSAVVYRSYSEQLKKNPKEAKTLDRNFQRAKNAATLDLTSSTKADLQSAINAYKESLMGLNSNKDSAWVFNLNLKLRELENPGQK